MNKISHPNTVALEAVTETIPESLLKQIVFVGGSTIGLYLNDLGRNQLRVTGDIDVVIGAPTKKKYFDFIHQLLKIGFYQSVESNDPPYRYRTKTGHGEIMVDVMSSSEIVLGFSNEWYDEGVKQAVSYTLSNGKEIRIFSLPYVLASKIVAYKNRGFKDPYASEDLEDIVALVDGADNLSEEMKYAQEKVKKFIFENFKKMLQDSEVKQAIEGHAPRGVNIFQKFEWVNT